MKFLILICIVLSTVSAAPAEHRVKRQLGLPFMGFGGLGGQLGMGGITNGFNGVHTGMYGGLVGSPVFGPGGLGPFNAPEIREDRILDLLNHNRFLADQSIVRGAMNNGVLGDLPQTRRANRGRYVVV